MNITHGSPVAICTPQIAIAVFEKSNGLFDFQWRYRCPICELPMKSARGMKIHPTKMYKAAREQEFKGRLADKAVQTDKLKDQQRHRTNVFCEDKSLEHVFKFISR